MEQQANPVMTKAGPLPGALFFSKTRAFRYSRIAGWFGMLATIGLLLANSVAAREFKITQDTEFRAGQNGTATVVLTAQGDENALGFSLQFDQGRLQYISAVMDGGVTGASLNVNDSQATTGRLGFVLAVPAGQSLPAGNVSLVHLTFAALAVSGETSIQFGDQPVFRELVDATAQELAATFTTAQIGVLPASTGGGNPQPPTISEISNQTTLPGKPIQIHFTVSDPDTVAEALTVVASSLNQTLLPDSALQVDGAGRDRRLTVTPVAGLAGNVSIELRVTDGALTSARVFTLSITNSAGNAPPNISTITARQATVNAPLHINFTIGDGATLPGALIVTATAENPAVLPASGISVSGTNELRTVSLTATNTGSTTVTVRVTDEGGLSASTTFGLTVQTNLPPTIESVPDQTVVAGGSVTVYFAVGDEGSLDALALSATSTVTSVVPVAGVQFGGAWGNRSATIVPSLTQPGSSRVTIMVTDPLGAKGEASFTVTVLAANLPPEITAIADVTTRENVPTGLINFFVADQETLAEELKVTAQAELAALVGAFEFGGAGFSRTLRIVPATNQIGISLITLSVTDGANFTRTNFVFRVEAADRGPRLSEIAPVTLTARSLSVDFTLQDADTPLDQIKLAAIADNAALFPPGSLEFGGAGTTRTLKLTPVPKQLGTTEITLTASDESAVATRKFTVTVMPAPNIPPLIALVSPPRNAVFTAPASVTIEAEIAAADGVIAKVAFLANDLRLGEVSAPPYRYVWTNVPPGEYTLQVVVTDNQGVISRSGTINIQVTRPEVANDHFVKAGVLAGTNINVQAANDFATLDPGEPQHAGKPGGRSLWWSWVAPATGAVSVSTLGSGIDTLLAVYTGAALTNLLTVASNDDDPDGGSTSRLVFPAVAGTEYLIAVDAFGGEAGTIQLELRAPGPPPPLGPPLKVETSGKNIVLSWPTNQTGFAPEFSDSLAPDSWLPLGQTPVQAGGQFSLKINAATGIRFFRLHRQ